MPKYYIGISAFLLIMLLMLPTTGCVTPDTTETSPSVSTADITTHPTDPTTTSITENNTTLLASESTTPDPITITTTQEETTTPPKLPDFSDPAYERHPYQDIIDAIRDIQPTDIPDHLMISSGNRTFEEFDVNEYFTVLTNISVIEGYTLNYVYSINPTWGRPIIYEQELSQEPYLNPTELQQERPDRIYSIGMGYFAVDSFINNLAWQESIVINETQQGFFEYLVLKIMGGQFYLWWHANYDDIMIICDCSGLQAVVDDIEDSFGKESPIEIIVAASELDLSPKIEFTDEYVIINAVFFTKWGGFLQGTFTINREFPHNISDSEWKVLIKYDCGASF